MWQLGSVFRLCSVAFVMTCALVIGPVWGQEAEAPDVSSWQSVITGQIEAFRRGDAETALGFAGTAFRLRYRDPLQFYAAVQMSGYGPIVDSRSHSFGDYQYVDGRSVVQVVKLQGPNHGLYQALYQLAVEPDGWRVQGVVLRKQAGIGV